MNSHGSSAVNSFTKKLRNFVPLTADEQRTLEAVVGDRTYTVASRVDIVEEGQRSDKVNVLLSGWACRYKQLEDGRRQIIAFLLPGDCCDHYMLSVDRVDHTIAALTSLTLAKLSRDNIKTLMESSESLSQAFLWESELNASIAREWIVTLGQREALERIAHLLCELFHRLRAVALTDGTSCNLPITQTDMADATGLTSVHVNRMLQELRGRDLIRWVGRRLTIPSLEALETTACFDPNYLHLGQET